MTVYKKLILYIIISPVLDGSWEWKLVMPFWCVLVLGFKLLPTNNTWIKEISMLCLLQILIVGGGIANFTNVAATFKGIVRALQEFQTKLIEGKVSIYVRRAGPNYQEGLR